MPREILVISKFTKGLVTAVDAGDLSPDAMANGSKNLDANAPVGQLQGRLGDTLLAKAFPATCPSAVGVRLTGTTSDLVFIDGANKVNYLPSFSGTLPTPTGAAITNPGNLVVFNQELRAAGDTPQYVKPVAAPTAYTTTTAQLSGASPSGTNRPIQVISGSVDANGSLQNNKTYFYKISLTYDGYQESPLNANQTATDLSIYGATGVQAGIRIPVRVFLPDSIKESTIRVTHFNLYRAEAGMSTTALIPSTLYTLVQQVALSASGWVDNAGEWYYDVSDVGIEGPTYEDRTGCSSTPTHNFVSYHLACVHNSSLIATNCTVAGLTDATHMLFKSKTNRPDMFDWINDYMTLPTIPTAMASFGGRLFVFDRTHLYRVNTEGMFIEDTVQGVGALGNKSVLSTEYGLFIADRGNLYMHDGSQLKAIGMSVVNKWKGWVDSDSLTDPIVMYHNRTGSILFIQGNVAGSATEWRALVYSISSGRWDEWGGPSAHKATACAVDHNGDCYLVSYNGDTTTAYLDTIANNSTRSYWTYISPKLDFDLPSQSKRFVDIRITGTAPGAGITAVFHRDEILSFDPILGSYGGISLNDLIFTMRMKITATATTAIVTSIDVIYRKKVSFR